MIVNQVGKNDTIPTLQVPQIAPNHTIEHLNFKNFQREDAP